MGSSARCGIAGREVADTERIVRVATEHKFDHLGGQLGFVELFQTPGQSFARFQKGLIGHQTVGQGGDIASLLDRFGAQPKRVTKMPAGQRQIVLAERYFAEDAMGIEAIDTSLQQPEALVTRHIGLAGFEHLANFVQVFLAVARTTRQDQLPGGFARALPDANASGRQRG